MDTRAAAAIAIVLAGIAACGDDDNDERGLEGLDTPTFEAVDDGSSTTGAAVSDTTTTVAGGTEAGSATTGMAAGEQPDVTPTTDRPQEQVSVDDPDDDAVGGLDDDPPLWADLAGLTLVRQGNAFGLRVQLSGGEAPETSNGESTMNIASFYDVDGDGAIDYEVWANLGPQGWGGSWFDDQGNGAFGEDSNVSIEVDGDEVVILFPDVMLGQPDRFRFSVASEYGELRALGSGFTRRDDVPDDDRAVSFPE